MVKIAFVEFDMPGLAKVRIATQEPCGERGSVDGEARSPVELFELLFQMWRDTKDRTVFVIDVECRNPHLGVFLGRTSDEPTARLIRQKFRIGTKKPPNLTSKQIGQLQPNLVF